MIYDLSGSASFWAIKHYPNLHNEHLIVYFGIELSMYLIDKTGIATSQKNSPFRGMTDPYKNMFST